MIVGNFYAAALGAVTSNIFEVIRCSSAGVSTTNTSGNTAIKSLLSYDANSNKDPKSSGKVGPYLALGTGNTPVTGADGNLDALTTEYDVVSTFCETQYGFDKSFFTITRIIQNNQDHNITIKEAGLFSQDSSNYSYLWARQVLDTPVVIKPGEKRAFVMTLSA